MPMVIKENMTPEEMRAEMLKGIEEQKILEQERDNLKTEKEKADQRIRELQDKNQDLFLKVTHKTDDRQKKEDEIPDCITKETYEKLSDKDIKELNELLEGDE